MPAKLTIEQIKQYLLENDVNHDCTLLSTEYINGTTPLKFICNCCNEEFERDWQHLKRGRFKCTKCANSTSPRDNRFSIEVVKNYLARNDINHECELLSTEYKNINTPLLFKCNICGKVFKRDFAHVQRGRFRCETCGELAGARTKKYDAEYVSKAIGEKGYSLIGEYKDAGTPVLVRCSKGHEFNLTFSHFLVGHSGCKQCANLNLRGANHWNFNGGGHAEIMEHCRDIIKPWKQRFYLSHNGISDITGEYKHSGLIIHHIHNFSEIVKEASNNTGIPLLNKISEYYDQGIDIKRLDEEVLRLSDIYPCVLMEREYHDEFHRIYGKTNNTQEQYDDFKEKIRKELEQS